LPVPDSPVSRIDVGRRATRVQSSSRTPRVAGDVPIRLSRRNVRSDESAQRVAQARSSRAASRTPIETARDPRSGSGSSERLQHEIDRARAQRLNRGVEISIGRDQDRVGEEADRPLLASQSTPFLPGMMLSRMTTSNRLLSSLREASVRVGSLRHMLAARASSVRTRKLRIPGSSSTIRIEACAERALNSGLLHRAGLFAGSFPAEAH
jgi:hypothetical protein